MRNFWVFTLNIIKNKKIAILGAGLTGKAMADWFLRNKNQVYIFDDNYNLGISNYILNHEFKKNINFVANPKYPFNFDVFDAVVLSPSFKLDKKYIVSNNYENFYTELDYFYPFIKDKEIFSITGTNGKTSSVKLFAKLLENFNRKVFLGGNVGVPIVHVLENDYDTVVLELSSFQLFYTKNFKSDYSILLNLAPDHLQWHKDFKEYAVTKLKLVDFTIKQAYVHTDFNNYLKEEQNAIIFNVNSHTKINKNKINKDKLPFFVNFIPIIDIMLNLGMPEENIISTINEIVWVKYRLTEKKVGNNTFINDSKSTNIDSTVFAISNYKNAILILGGDDKELDYTTFIDLFKDKNIKKIIVFGGLKDKLLNILKNDFDTTSFDTLTDVFTYFKDIKIENEIILFSPSSSSFDLYENYVKRGEHFDLLVGEFFE
jgi:UDP-N-acetylmuramoylalanine--D-glutamate ligase